MTVRVYARYLTWPAGAPGTPAARRAYQSVRVVHYVYALGGTGGEVKFHLLAEVGQPWQGLVQAKLAGLLRANPSFELKQVELPTHPWYVDALVRKPAAGTPEL